MDMSDLIIQTLTAAFLQNGEIAVQAIFLYGSKTDPATVDPWSDTDLALILSDRHPLEPVTMDEILSALGPILGREMHRDNEKMVLRYILYFRERIERIDLSVYRLTDWNKKVAGMSGKFIRLFGNAPMPGNGSVKNHFNTAYDPNNIDRIWLLYYECVKKFMRGDYLIGSHLLLELVRENLVLEMLERDRKMGTNIHRHGQQEPLFCLDPLLKLAGANDVDIVACIRSLGRRYDRKLRDIVVNYESRLPPFEQYLRQAIK